ncbi:hypothetical protein [Paenibacillus wynnii]|uniref:hypothetical protein n=1 Tax=Paenibacillus wynnii TaxID=268407 RepID=UPI0027944453|nr:hypothetical protein [Paenibacillus wynnii]MDQ0193275.1 hypothetical protein [Paenibacillus wynnii]
MNLSERSIAIGTEMIDKEYEYFTYHFSNCYSCYFVPWDTMVRVDETSEITELELEINESEPEGEYIKITCLSDKPGIEGGYLFINSDHLTIYDHVNQELTFDDMRILANRYWNSLR